MNESNEQPGSQIAYLQQRLSDMEARYQRYQEMFPGAINRIDELDREVESLRTEVKRLGGERNSLLRCSKGHIHNQAYGRRCPICERDALREGLEKLERELYNIGYALSSEPHRSDNIDTCLGRCVDVHLAAQALLSGSATGEPSADPDSPTSTAPGAPMRVW